MCKQKWHRHPPLYKKKMVEGKGSNNDKATQHKTLNVYTSKQSGWVSTKQNKLDRVRTKVEGHHCKVS